MLYIIGLGLGDEQDITLKGLEAIQNCDKVYMEAYTSLLSFGLSSHGLSNLEKLYGKPITIADREMVEEKADDILSQAQLSLLSSLLVILLGLLLTLTLLFELRRWELKSKLCTMHLL